MATTGMPDAFTSAITDSIRPETGAFSPVPKIASTISVQSLTSEKCSSHAWLSADLHDGDAEAAEDLEVDPRIAAHVRDAAEQERPTRRRRAAQRARDDEAVAAVVAAAAQHRDLAIEEVAVHRLHRGDRLAAGVLHQHERRDADLVDRPAIGLAHLGGVQYTHQDCSARIP